MLSISRTEMYHFKEDIIKKDPLSPLVYAVTAEDSTSGLQLILSLMMGDDVVVRTNIHGAASAHLWGANRCGRDKRGEGVSGGAEQITLAVDNGGLQLQPSPPSKN
ncbi:hypothetical protein EYF80_034219 [Liparis tanakae]|uniref:Uncharacterized protein n=1 Tax=Liparis tanakae TaxID=230148 RepID=A0A4Z2GQI1_9TELE|nr:hypothetical protein EYF80_034219 [Liparis tanakae]